MKEGDDGDGSSDGDTGGVTREEGAKQKRQYGSLELLKEVDYYALSVTMLLTVVSGLFIAGTALCLMMSAFSDNVCTYLTLESNL